VIWKIYRGLWEILGVVMSLDLKSQWEALECKFAFKNGILWVRSIDEVIFGDGSDRWVWVQFSYTLEFWPMGSGGHHQEGDYHMMPSNFGCILCITCRFHIQCCQIFGIR